MIDRKADILLLIMGGNPFPNLISSATRVKVGGKIICICTEETSKGLYESFKRTIQSKIDIDFDKVAINDNTKNYINRSVVKGKIIEKLEAELSLNTNIDLLELNYTGGTKLMSTTIYEVVKNYDFKKLNMNPKINLTYIDPERELMYCEFREKNKKSFNLLNIELSKLEQSFELNIKDIIDTYIVKNNIKANHKPEMPELSTRLGSLWCNIDKEKYDETVKIFERLYYYSCNKSEDDINQIFIDYELLPYYENIESLGFKGKRRLFRYFKKTTWLEDYILNVLLELKDEGIIEDVVSNIEISNDNKQTEFEVDFAAYRKYKLFAISVTSINSIEEAKGKLYEIKQRAKNLAGDEAGACYINMCWDTDELEGEYKNIWDREDLKDSLILGAQDFHILKDRLRNWLKGGECFGS